MKQDARNPYGYATNEYWQFEAERHGFSNPQDWLRAEEREAIKQRQNRCSTYDYDHTETYDDGY